MMKDWNRLAQEAHEKHFVHDAAAASKYPGGRRALKEYRNRLILNRQYLEAREEKEA
jgi:hypothetical protein